MQTLIVTIRTNKVAETIQGLRDARFGKFIRARKPRPNAPLRALRKLVKAVESGNGVSSAISRAKRQLGEVVATRRTVRASRRA